MTTFASVFCFWKLISNLEFPFVWMNFVKASSMWQVAEKLVFFFVYSFPGFLSAIFFFHFPNFN